MSDYPIAGSLPLGLAAGRAAAETLEREVMALFDECGAGLRRYLASFSLGAEVTDDLLQDVFVALFRHLARGRPRTHLKAWLFRVAHNLALKYRRTVQRRARREADWDGYVAERAIDPGASPESRLRATRRRRALLALLASMPERDRRCLYLRAEGLTYRDIGATLDISLGSVAKSLARALAALTDIDKEHEP